MFYACHLVGTESMGKGTESLKYLVISFNCHFKLHHSVLIITVDDAKCLWCSMALPQRNPRQVIISGKIGGIDSSQSLNKTLKRFKHNPRERGVIFVSSD